MNKILITGDTHGQHDIAKLSSKRFQEGKKLTKDDFVIIAGDFGFIWKNIPDATEAYYLKWFQDKPWTTLFVDGNHENHPRLNQLPIIEKFSGKVGMVNDSVYHLKRGEVYTINGKKIFTFGGAMSWDKEHRTTGISWWPEEQPSWAEFEYGFQNLENHNNEVDYIVSHTVPGAIMNMIGGVKGEDSTTRYLDHIAGKVKWKKFFCGHMHEDRKIGNFRLLYQDIVDVED